MQDLSSLIRQSLDGSASAEELKQLLQQLDQQEQVLYQEWMRESAARSNEAPYPVFNQQQVKALIEAKIASEAKLVSIKRRSVVAGWLKMGAVAAAILGIVWAVNFMYKADVGMPVMQGENITAVADRIINAGNSNQFVLLPDSSEVLLYAGSTLRFDSSYNSHERKLYIKGKGRFTVKQDKQKPFIVYSRHLATTALGTAFEVWEKNDSTTIRLLNGKVSVCNYTAAVTHTVYLHPGDQAMGYKDATLAVQTAEAEERWATHARPPHTDKKPVMQPLSFKQMPLEHVFNLLQKRYKLTIVYHKEDIAGMMFTGEFGEQDNLATVLRVIANMNNLEIQPTEQGFVIQK